MSDNDTISSAKGSDTFVFKGVSTAELRKDVELNEDTLIVTWPKQPDKNSLLWNCHLLTLKKEFIDP